MEHGYTGGRERIKCSLQGLGGKRDVHCAILSTFLIENLHNKMLRGGAWVAVS